jgi:hypothetical protein
MYLGSTQLTCLGYNEAVLLGSICSLDEGRGWKLNSSALSFSLAGEEDRHVRAWELGEERWKKDGWQRIPRGGAGLRNLFEEQ